MFGAQTTLHITSLPRSKLSVSPGIISFVTVFFWVPEYINIQTTIIETNVGDFWPEGGTPGGLEPSF